MATHQIVRHSINEEDIDSKKSFEDGDLSLRVSRYDSGIPFAEIATDRLVTRVLIDQGMQVWNTQVDSIRIGMQSRVKEPLRMGDPEKYPLAAHLESYSCDHMFCGPMGIGYSPDCGHPLHDVLPMAKFGNTGVEFGVDASGRNYVEVEGRVTDERAKQAGWGATASIRAYRGSGLMRAAILLENIKNEPLKISGIQQHPNTSLIPSHEITDTVDWSELGKTKYFVTPDDIPAGFKADPGLYNKITDRTITFEALIELDLRTDESGNAYAMRQHPDGGPAYCVIVPTHQFNSAIRWMMVHDKAKVDETMADPNLRLPVENAAGLILPTDTLPNGRINAEQRGDLFVLEPRGKAGSIIYRSCVFGGLDEYEATAMKETIGLIKQYY